MEGEPDRLLADYLPAANQKYEIDMTMQTNRYANNIMIARTHLEANFEFCPKRQKSAEQLCKLVGIMSKLRGH